MKFDHLAHRQKTFFLAPTSYCLILSNSNYLDGLYILLCKNTTEKKPDA